MNLLLRCMSETVIEKYEGLSSGNNGVRCGERRTRCTRVVLNKAYRKCQRGSEAAWRRGCYCDVITARFSIKIWARDR
jgi:hypothetical protein